MKTRYLITDPNMITFLTTYQALIPLALVIQRVGALGFPTSSQSFTPPELLTPLY